MYRYHLYQYREGVLLSVLHYGFVFQEDPRVGIGQDIRNGTCGSRRQKGNDPDRQEAETDSHRPGVQYTSQEYADETEGIAKSYSRKGNPWDNACIESFHALIKREWLWRFKIKDYEHARRLIFEYVDTFYNTVRIHSHCGYESPATYERQYYQRLKEMEKVA